METKVLSDLSAPVCMEIGMVITGIVGDDDSFAASPSRDPFELPEKLPAGLAIKHALGLRHHQLPVGQAHCPEETDTLARGCVQAHRVLHLWGNPHAATRTMLLEMHFIHRPQIDCGVSGQCAEFFYARLVTAGRLEPLEAGVCATETPVVGTTADIAGLSSSPPTRIGETPTGSGRPTSGLAVGTCLGQLAFIQATRASRPFPVG